VRRIYIPLPDAASRRALVSLLLTKQGPGGADMLQPRHLERVVAMTEGYSGSDLTAVRTSLLHGGEDMLPDVCLSCVRCCAAGVPGSRAGTHPGAAACPTAHREGRGRASPQRDGMLLALPAAPVIGWAVDAY
jgi:hypothetical protein